MASIPSGRRRNRKRKAASAFFRVLNLLGIAMVIVSVLATFLLVVLQTHKHAAPT